MNAQEVINVLFMIAGFLGGWMLKRIWSAVDDLTHADQNLVEKVHQLDRVIAGDYVKRDEMNQLRDWMGTRFDRIEVKLDTKMDKLGSGNSGT